MPASLVKPSSLSNISSGISNTTVYANNYVESNVIDNTSSRYQYLRATLLWKWNTAPSSPGTPVELQILRFDAQADSWDDAAETIAMTPPYADTNTHQKTILEFFPLAASKYKIRVRNPHASISLVNVTLYLQGFNDEVVS